MADQGRNADGLGDTAEAVNVVRFPGDWFGPLEDLVPIGSDADWERGDPGTEAPPDEDASAFWGEDAETVHRVDAPQGGDPTRTRDAGRLRRVLISTAALAVALVAAGIVLIPAGSRDAPRAPVQRHAGAAPKPIAVLTRTVTVAAPNVGNHRLPTVRSSQLTASVDATRTTAARLTPTYRSHVSTASSVPDTEVTSSTSVTRPTASGLIAKPRPAHSSDSPGDALPDLEQIQQQP